MTNYNRGRKNAPRDPYGTDENNKSLKVPIVQRCFVAGCHAIPEPHEAYCAAHRAKAPETGTAFIKPIPLSRLMGGR